MNNPLPFRGISPNKIRVLQPKTFEEAQEAIILMKLDDMLLVNLTTLESKLAQRLVDYLSGSAFALSGEYIEIGKGVFLLAPPSFSITRMMVPA